MPGPKFPILVDENYRKCPECGSILVRLSKDPPDYCDNCGWTEKQVGEYPGSLKAEAIEILENGPEVSVYLFIDQLGGFLWRTHHDAAHGRIKITEKLQKDITNTQYAVEYAVLKSRRFGVEIETPEKGKHIVRTESYNKWFRWWDDYVSGLLEEQFRDLDHLLATNQDVSMYRPKGDWK